MPIEQIASGMPIILAQDDQKLIDYIWFKKYILPPSTKPYNLVDPKNDPSRGQGQFIRNVLSNIVRYFKNYILVKLT